MKQLYPSLSLYTADSQLGFVLLAISSYYDWNSWYNFQLIYKKILTFKSIDTYQLLHIFDCDIETIFENG